MFATFEIAVMNRSADAINRMRSAGRTSPAAASLASCTVIWIGSRAPNSDIATGPASGAAIARAVPSAAACAAVTPGLRRATVRMIVPALAPPGWSTAGICHANHAAVSAVGNRKSRGITPTMV